MLLSILGVWSTFVFGVLCFLDLYKVHALSFSQDPKSKTDQNVSQKVPPLKFPGYLFVPFTTPVNVKRIDKKEDNGFEGLDEDVVNNYIDDFIQQRYLDLMKDEIISHYDKNKKTASSFLPFDVDSLTNQDIERGLLNYNNDRRYRVCGSCAPGYPGPRGHPGRTGVTGLFGDKGNLGPRGFRGDQGVKGRKGIRQKGMKGTKGFKGRKGELGDSGSKGFKGVKLKGNKGNHHHGLKGVSVKGPKGNQGDDELCCNPGLFDTTNNLCYIYVPEELTYMKATNVCLSYGAQVVDFSSSSISESDIQMITNFMDMAGINVWSLSPGTSSCFVWDFGTPAGPYLEPCIFTNDFICQHTSTVCPPTAW